MTLLEPLLQHILEPPMLLVPQDMMELLPQHKFSVRQVGIGQLLQDAPSKVKQFYVLLENKYIERGGHPDVAFKNYITPSRTVHQFTETTSQHILEP